MRKRKKETRRRTSDGCRAAAGAERVEVGAPPSAEARVSGGGGGVGVVAEAAALGLARRIVARDGGAEAGRGSGGRRGLSPGVLVHEVVVVEVEVDHLHVGVGHGCHRRRRRGLGWIGFREEGLG